MREQRRLMAFQNMELRRTFGPKYGRGNKGVEKTTQRAA